MEWGIATIREIASRLAGMDVFVASGAAEAKLFWNDRKTLGAMARRTNAFKLNEDVVLPLAALAELARARAIRAETLEALASVDGPVLRSVAVAERPRGELLGPVRGSAASVPGSTASA